MIPTEKAREFWKLCGFEWHDMIGLWHDPIHGLISSILPPIDLNNLFKYAPGNIQSITITETKWADDTVWTQCHLCIEFKEIYGEKVKGKMKDVAAEALFEAIYKALGGNQ